MDDDKIDGDKITVAFLDVGQGDATAIILPDASTAVLVDCPMARRQAVIDYLSKSGIDNLHVFITHTDADHFGGTVALLENFAQTKTLAYNHDMIPEHPRRRTTFRLLRQMIDRNGFTTFSPRTGHHWTYQGVDIEVLHPSDEDTKRCFGTGDTNNTSVVLRVAYAGKRVLLTADVQGQGWQWIMDRSTDLKADVLKFPHHGAWYEHIANGYPSLEDLLNQVSPSLVIISAGTHNSYTHPHSNTLALLRESAHLRFVCTEATSQCHSLLKSVRKGFQPCAGTVEVVISQDGLQVLPDATEHAKVVTRFDNPQCKNQT